MKLLLITALIFSYSTIAEPVKQAAKSKASSVPAKASKKPYYTVYADKLNVRAQPNLQSKVLGQLAKGEKVQVHAIANEYFFRIEYNGRIAYVSTLYLRKKAY